VGRSIDATPEEPQPDRDQPPEDSIAEEDDSSSTNSRRFVSEVEELDEETARTKITRRIRLNINRRLSSSSDENPDDRRS